MTKEALKMALEALETNNKAWKHLADSGDAGFWEAEEQPFYEMSVKAIAAIKDALENDTLQERVDETAKQRHEPVAFEKTVCPFCTSEWVTAEQHDRNVDRVERTPLTDKYIASIFKAQRMVYNTDGVPFARAIEAAHGIKGEV